MAETSDITMSIIKKMLQETIIFMIRPLIFREVGGWGKLYKIFVGDYKRNDFWQNAKKRTIKGKLNHFLMELDLSRWSDRSTFFLGRWYDLPIQKLLEQLLSKGDEVIDIGANVGNFALSARNIVGSEGFVYCFEPNPEPRKKLNHNIQINHIENIKVYSVGLGKVEGSFSLYIPYINSGEGSLSSFPKNEYEKTQWYEILVDVKVGDDILKNAVPRLIKIDVEGAEVGVLQGISNLIDKHKPLIIAEYVPKHLSRFGNSFEDILSIAQQHSYKVFKLGLTKVNNKYDVSLIPFGDDNTDESCDLLLAYGEDPYIQHL